MEPDDDVVADGREIADQSEGRVLDAEDAVELEESDHGDQKGQDKQRKPAARDGEDRDQDEHDAAQKPRDEGLHLLFILIFL